MFRDFFQRFDCKMRRYETIFYTRLDGGGRAEGSIIPASDSTPF